MQALASEQASNNPGPTRWKHDKSVDLHMSSHFTFDANFPAHIHIPRVGSILTSLLFVRVDGRFSAFERKRLSVVPFNDVELNCCVSAIISIRG